MEWSPRGERGGEEMGIAASLPGSVLLFALWVWIAKSITNEARRQLQAEISDLEETIRLCDEELASPEMTEEAKGYIEGVRVGCRRSLAYLRSKLDDGLPDGVPGR